MLDKWENGELDFMPKCPEYLLREQLATMKDYIGILQTRAKIEGVDLTADVDKAGWIPISERLPEEHNWMERNKERILQAGMEGREIEFRIGGRLFAIREKAQ